VWWKLLMNPEAMERNFNPVPPLAGVEVEIFSLRGPDFSVEFELCGLGGRRVRFIAFDVLNLKVEGFCAHEPVDIAFTPRNNRIFIEIKATKSDVRFDCACLRVSAMPQ